MSEASGKWDIVTNTPMGQQKGVLSLEINGAELTGTLSGEQGSIELADGKADGDNLSWSAQIQQPMPMKLDFSATVEGDSISGNVKLGMFGSADFSGTRSSG